MASYPCQWLGQSLVSAAYSVAPSHRDSKDSDSAGVSCRMSIMGRPVGPEGRAGRSEIRFRDLPFPTRMMQACRARGRAGRSRITMSQTQTQARSSYSLGVPKPAGSRPETRLVGYKLNPVINTTFPSSVCFARWRGPGAAPPDSEPEAGAGQWELFVFYSLARLAQLCSFLVKED